MAASGMPKGAKKKNPSFDDKSPTVITTGPIADKGQLVLTKGNEMPRRCPLCNSEDVVDPVELSIRRESKQMGGVSGLVKSGIDMAAGWNYTGPVNVSVYFCQAHRNRFRNWILTGVATMAACGLYLLIALLIFDKNRPRGNVDVMVAVVGAFVGLLIVEIFRQNPALAWFKPRRFVDRAVWVKGASRKFLESLPTTDE